MKGGDKQATNEDKPKVVVDGALDGYTYVNAVVLGSAEQLFGWVKWAAVPVSGRQLQNTLDQSGLAARVEP